MVDSGTLLLATGAILVTSSLRGLFAYGQGYLSQAVSNLVAYDLRNRLYDHLQTLSFSFHDEAETGQLMSRLTVDIEAVRNFIPLGLLRGLLALVTFGAVTIILFRLDWHLALITMICVPILILLSVQVGRRLRPIWLDVQNETGALGTVMQESLSGMRVVKAFAREDFEIAKYETKNREVRELNMSAMRLSAWNQPLMVLVLNVVTCADYMGRRHCGNRASTQSRRVGSRHTIHTAAGHSCAFLRLHGHLVYARRLRRYTYLQRAGYTVDHLRCAWRAGTATSARSRSL